MTNWDIIFQTLCKNASENCSFKQRLFHSFLKCKELLSFFKLSSTCVISITSLACNLVCSKCTCLVKPILYHKLQLDTLPHSNVTQCTLTRSAGQYHGCWCPGSLRHQAISSNGIDYVNLVGLCFTWGRISITCVMSMWRNDRNCKYMYVLKNLTHKELSWNFAQCFRFW